MFHAASALAIHNHCDFHRHLAAISWFQREYVRPADFPSSAIALQGVFQNRCYADYTDVAMFPPRKRGHAQSGRPSSGRGEIASPGDLTSAAGPPSLYDILTFVLRTPYSVLRTPYSTHRPRAGRVPVERMVGHYRRWPRSVGPIVPSTNAGSVERCSSAAMPFSGQSFRPPTPARWSGRCRGSIVVNALRGPSSPPPSETKQAGRSDCEEDETGRFGETVTGTSQRSLPPDPPGRLELKYNIVPSLEMHGVSLV